MMRPLRVLLAEDNPADTELVLRELRRAGFEPEWVRVDTEAEYLKRLNTGIDIVLSDYDMPQFGGPRALELLRERDLDVPFIIISGTIGEDIAVDVMKQGAADYLMKDRLTRLGPAVSQAIEQTRLRRERKQTEKSLRQSEAEFRAMTEASPLGIFVADVNGVSTYTNVTLRRMLGISFQETADNGWTKSLHPLDREELLVKWQEAVANKQGFEGTARFVRPEGAVIQTSIKTAVMREQDRVLGFVGVVDDITEQKQAEEALRESEARTLLLVHSSSIGLWDWNLITNEVFFSEEWKSQLGYAGAEVSGRYEEWESRLHPEDREPALAAVRDHVDGRSADYDVEFRLRHKDGSWRSILARAKLTCNEIGTPVHIMGCHIDITERKRTEARFRRLVDSNAQGVMFFKTSGEITGANDAYLRLTGYSRADLEAGRMNWIAMTPPEFTDTCRRCMEQIAAKGVCAPFEKEYLRKDGSRVPVFISAASFEDNPEEGVCFAVDLTERKKLEQQFLRSQRMESIGTLAGGIAHDLNNILAPIMMSVPVLRMDLPDTDRERIISTIEMCAERGAQIVKQVLTFGRGLEGEKRPLQVGALISEIVKIIHATFPKNITVEKAIEPGLWPMLGDATQLHQVLLNLCVNARDAMPDGGRLRLSARNLVLDASYSSMMPGTAPGPYVLLEASDSGSGIPPEIVERIFDPFFTTKGIGKGTGLGLSTVLGIVKNHGGHINVTSERGGGTTFQIYLPASADCAGSLHPSDPAVRPPEGRGECVLVVDDEETVRGAAKTVLEAHGYRVMQAADGTEALAIFAKNSAGIAVVLTDLMMPLMDGVVLIHALRKMQPGLPIIASTGLGEKTRLAELQAMNVKAVLNKPYGAGTLLRIVHEILHPTPEEPQRVR